MPNYRQVHVISHVVFEDLGCLDTILKQWGCTIRYFEAGLDDISIINDLQPDLLIVLGGPIGVYDDKHYPFLKTEHSILKSRITRDLPTLGICLGAQLIAHVLGSNVYPGMQKEIGWYKLKVFNQSDNDYFKHLKQTAVLHWHGDTFDLPKGAVLNASTDLYPNQAFTYGKNILALQFHLEVTASGMERWFIGHANEIFATKDISVTQLRSDTKKYFPEMTSYAEKFFSGWLKNIFT